MILFPSVILLIVILAIILDAIVGDPDWLWNRLPHPVVWFGKSITWFEERLNQPDIQSPFKGRMAGVVALVSLITFGGFLSWLVQTAMLSLGLAGILVIAVLGAMLIAQKCLFEHLEAISVPLRNGDIEGARYAVSMIVGRDTKRLDAAGVTRAGIESLAENFSDGIVAPIFWFAVFGLPGLVVYKIVNTADSMIGHKSDRYLYFGWAAARLDDVLNLIPARLTMLLLLFSPFSSAKNTEKKSFSEIWAGIMKDAPRHRSPNAGWPEAAMAGRLNIALSGPRYYGAELVDEPFVNDTGKRDIGADEITAALSLYRASCFVQFAVIVCAYLISL